MSTSTIRWLHLSDFHVGKDDYAGRKMFDYIIEHVRKRCAEGLAPDLLFFTGDIAQDGRSEQYDAFWLEFVAPLQETIGGDIATRTFAVPGNHDVNRKETPAFSREEMAAAESHYFDPTAEGNKLRGMIIPRFQAYVANDCSQARGAFDTPRGAFSEIVSLRGSKIGIVGINTAWLSKDKYDHEKLTPGKPLLESALGSVVDSQLRIVLGHHPVDWLLPAEQRAIKSLLGRHHALYLHGHLHEAWAEPTYGGGQSFLSIQSGACFQAREKEIWRNGLTWGEIRLQQEVVRLQPWRWTPDQQGWTLAADAFHESHRVGEWWHYSLPGTRTAKQLGTPAPVRVAPLPKGWEITEPASLERHRVTLDGDTAVRFFDGATPDWRTALSPSIPHRKVVANIESRLRDAASAELPIVTLLVGAGCEGKTTALLQAAYAVVAGNNDWRVLRRTNDAATLKEESIIPILESKYRWLLVIDEADVVAPALLSLLHRLPAEMRGRVHCMMACRDTDWRASGAESLRWSDICTFSIEKLVGLDHEDAKAITESWGMYGDAGLCDLVRVPADRRAEALENQAKVEAKTARGAFFGALLAVRHGDDLQNHARRLLERLGERAIPSGGNLRQAMAYIAAMHAIGLEILSRPVLAQALGCPIEKLHRQVLVPLGQEAAATTTSTFIFTRHRRIAEAILTALAHDFGEDIGHLYIELATSAVTSFKSGLFIPELGDWRYNLSSNFFDAGEVELALRIADAVLSCEPESPRTRVHVASLYRKAKAPERATELLRDTKTEAPDRSYYFEWSVTEGACHRPHNAVLLAAYSISDQCFGPRVDNDTAKRALAGMGVSLRELFDLYRDITFRDARMAVAVLGEALLLDATTASYFRQHADEAARSGAARPEIEVALEWLRSGISASLNIGVDEQIGERINNCNKMSFEGLSMLIKSSRNVFSKVRQA